MRQTTYIHYRRKQLHVSANQVTIIGVNVEDVLFKFVFILKEIITGLVTDVE
jgi:hypothetical protein